MNPIAVIEAIGIIKNRPAKALVQLKELLASDDDRHAFDTLKYAREIVRLCDEAGVGVDFLQTYTTPKPKTVKRVHLTTEMTFSPAGAQLPVLYLDDLMRHSARVDLDGFTIEPAEEQTADDVEQLLAIVADFNAGTPGKSPEGLAVLKRVGIGGFIAGVLGGGKDAKDISGRFKLWRLRKAAYETRLIKTREPKYAMPHDDIFCLRLGMGGLVGATLTGDHSPQGV